jgi:arsenite/tail-anchored protein-transporting ATPase
MRLILYTGKGGTGKTVTSSSTAIKLSDRNHKTLLISSDPAHTLGDAFMIPNEISENYDIQEVIPKLFLLQVDPIREINKKYNNLLSYMASLFIQKGLDESISYEIAMMPGMTQLFSLLKIEEIMQDNSFDAVVLDMPASGEALRYLYLPKLVGDVGKKLMGLFGLFSGFSKIFQMFSAVSVPNNISQFEQDFFDRLKSLANIITDYKTTSIRLVVNPDSFSIENAKRALMLASLYGINVDLAIINKIWPATSDNAGNSSDTYYTKWSNFQRIKVEEARINFYPIPVREIPLHHTELAGIELLRLNANLLFGEEDPAQIFYHGNPLSIVQNAKNKLTMVVKVPFTEQKDFDIKRVSGGEVIIKVKSPTGVVANVLPLPTIAYDMKIIKVQLNSNNLIISFERTS